ncbi:MAG: glycosyltransferase family 2 protein, partial [Gammaproteobacteria bacterium]|nr:glycosyltransferase family 2 protein [Gammaproteobacteria bacterium]MBT5372642.1 glycosyltransferase family 2 protein [Gammaproteobacteria bacterium]
DEVVVVDSGSTDRTIEIAEQAGARVIHQHWLGYGRQKQYAVEQANNDWVLSLDADEWLSVELSQSIQNILLVPRLYAYQSPRCNRFMGRWLKHGEGYPDLSLRLFHRAYAEWSSDVVHEKVVAKEAVGVLSGDLLHESEETLQQYLDKQNRYTTLQAEQLHQKGKQFVLPKLFLSPLLRFIKFYFFRRGFLDGVPGLIHILIGCHNSFMKQAKLLEKTLSD